MKPDLMTDALPRRFTRFLRLAKISPNVARNASLVLTALLRQLLTLLFHRVANRVANFAASDVASRDHHPVANPVASPLPTVLLIGKTCFYGGVIGLSGRRPNLCGWRVAGGPRWPASLALWVPRPGAGASRGQRRVLFR